MRGIEPSWEVMQRLRDGMRGVEPSWSSWRGRDAVSVTSRCSCKREGRSSLWLQAVPVDTSRCSRRKRGRLSDVMLFAHERRVFSLASRYSSCDFKVFSNEERTSLGRHDVPEGREDVSPTSRYSWTKEVSSLWLHAVPADTSRGSRTKEMCAL